VGENAFVVKDYDAVGVTLLVLGCIEVLVGVGILNKSRLAQILGIALASLGFLIHLAYFRHYPAWAVAMMVLNLVVIYALTVHNDQFKGTRRRR
jgi:O-antigen ligase